MANMTDDDYLRMLQDWTTENGEPVSSESAMVSDSPGTTSSISSWLGLSPQDASPLNYELPYSDPLDGAIAPDSSLTTTSETGPATDSYMFNSDAIMIPASPRAENLVMTGQYTSERQLGNESSYVPGKRGSPASISEPSQHPFNLSSIDDGPVYPVDVGNLRNSMGALPAASVSPREAFAASPGSATQTSRANEAAGRRNPKRTKSSVAKPQKSMSPELKSVGKIRKPVDAKKSHSLVERRYREQLGDKMDALRDAVPALRAMSQSNNGENSPKTPASKIQKGEILVKAVEYISELERKVNQYAQQCSQLKIHMETLRDATSLGTVNETPSHSLAISQASLPQQAGQQQQPVDQQLVSRLLMGGMAGLMMLSGLQSQDQSSGHSGLSSLPIPAGWRTVSNSPFLFAFHILRWTLVLVTLAFVCLPKLFRVQPNKQTTEKGLSTDPYSAPLEVHRNAWLTAVQGVWVPDSDLGDMLAVAVKASKLLLRQALGWRVYSRVFRITDDEEKKRIKDWTIAIDAQLSGGDDSISFYRCLLTFLASLTLPGTPALRMMNALHVQVLFHERSLPLGGYVRNKLSNVFWQSARRLAAARNDNHVEKLPPHKACLLQLDAQAVFSDTVVTAFHNLTFHDDVKAHSIGVEGFGVAVQASASQSPLFLLCAFASSERVHKALMGYLAEQVEEKQCSWKRFAEEIELAREIAPPLSSAYARATAALALLSPKNGNGCENINDCLSTASDCAGERAVLQESRAALLCGRSLQALDDKNLLALATACRCLIQLSSINMQDGKQRFAVGLLDFVARYRVAQELAAAVTSRRQQGLPKLSTEEQRLARRALAVQSQLMKLWLHKQICSSFLGWDETMTDDLQDKCVEWRKIAVGML